MNHLMHLKKSTLKAAVTLGLWSSLLGGAITLEASPQKIADLEVKVGEKFVGKNTAGLRTLYIILYNAQSAMPMPYAAVKVDLSQDPKGTVYKGILTPENINVMSGGELPQNFRIKARLDKDGSAGKDSPGDLVGLADGIKRGDKVTITIDKEI